MLGNQHFNIGDIVRVSYKDDSFAMESFLNDTLCTVIDIYSWTVKVVPARNEDVQIFNAMCNYGGWWVSKSQVTIAKEGDDIG